VATEGLRQVRVCGSEADQEQDQLIDRGPEAAEPSWHAHAAEACVA
jgi:hypothetical protein